VSECVEYRVDEVLAELVFFVAGDVVFLAVVDLFYLFEGLAGFVVAVPFRTVLDTFVEVVTGEEFGVGVGASFKRGLRH
jgi:hypothetical protein